MSKVAIFGNGLWMESFNVARTSITATSTASTTFELEQAGIVVACGCQLSATTSNIVGVNASIVSDAGGVQLLIGAAVSAIRLIRSNDEVAASTQTFGADGWILLRKAN